MAVALFGLITACDDRGASTGPPDAPVLGSVVASVDVSGTGRDRDGFTVNLGDDQSRALSADVEVTFSSIEAGTYTITLSGVAGNCVSTSSSSQTVTVEAGATVDVVFEVECGHLVYVGRQFDRAVSVISTLNNGHVAEIDMNGRYVGDLAVSTDGALLFVSHTSDNTVSIVETSTNTVVRVVDVGELPRHVTVGPGGSSVYVSNEAGESISVLDVAAQTVRETIEVGFQPGALAFRPDGELMYVARRDDHVVSVMDVGSGDLLTTLYMASRPWDLAVSPGGHHVYVANTSFGTGSSPNVTVIETASNTVVSTIGLAAGALAISLTPDGELAYAVSAADAVSVIPTGGTTVAASIDVGEQPGDVASTPDGAFAFVTVSGEDRVAVIETASSAEVASIVTPGRPRAVAIAPY